MGRQAGCQIKPPFVRHPLDDSPEHSSSRRGDYAMSGVSLDAHAGTVPDTNQRSLTLFYSLDAESIFLHRSLATTSISEPLAKYSWAYSIEYVCRLSGHGS